MAREVEVTAVGDALELRPADRVVVLDVARALGVVRALLRPVLPHAQPRPPQPVLDVPLEPGVDPVPVPLVGLRRRHEVLHLHLLELAHAEEEVPGRDLVAERLADLRDSERRPPPRQLEDVLEVDEDALCRLRSQERTGALLGHGADRGLEHEVELARLGQIALGVLSGPLRRLPAALRVLELVGAEAQLAGAAVDERVREALDVARSLPDPRMEDHRGVDQHDVVALLHHRLEPTGADVVLDEHAVVAVVEGRAEPAVDLGRREHEAAPTAERDDLVHGHFVGHWPDTLTPVVRKERAQAA